MSGGGCLFAADLHGREDRYRKLFRAVSVRRPRAVFLGGDLLPHRLARRRAAGEGGGDFVREVLAAGFEGVRREMGPDYPSVFVILGNDDPRSEEAGVVEAGSGGLWEYAHGRRIPWGELDVFGYSCIPPSPFRLKDWERYDVSRFVDPGSYPPEEGWHTVATDERELRFGTIRDELERLAGDLDLSRSVFLFHVPPYRTGLDRAALDGRWVDHAPLDVHVGSIAVRRFIEQRQPRVTLHGHVHESARITGVWKERLGGTWALSAAHDGDELALVTLDPSDPGEAVRELL